MDTDSSPAATALLLPKPPRRKYSTRRRVWEWSIVALVLFVLAGLVLPIFNSTCVRSNNTKALAQAKQIALALKLYAGDHDGVYPAGVNTDGETIRTSNDAFRSLFPTYTQSETIFGIKTSHYQRLTPDDKTEPRNEILRPGENVFAYVMGATESMLPTTPLVADGTDGTGRGTYAGNPTKLGSAWGGMKATVIYLDTHGTIENLTGPADARYVSGPLPDGTLGNILSPAALAPKLKLLDPAVPPTAPTR